MEILQRSLEDPENPVRIRTEGRLRTGWRHVCRGCPISTAASNRQRTEKVRCQKGLKPATPKMHGANGVEIAWDSPADRLKYAETESGKPEHWTGKSWKRVNPIGVWKSIAGLAERPCRGKPKDSSFKEMLIDRAKRTKTRSPKQNRPYQIEPAGFPAGSSHTILFIFYSTSRYTPYVTHRHAHTNPNASAITPSTTASPRPRRSGFPYSPTPIPAKISVSRIPGRI